MVSKPKWKQPHGLQHVILGCLFVAYAFGVFAYPFEYAMRQVTQSLAFITIDFATAYFLRPVVGFLLPLLVAVIFSLIACLRFLPSPNHLTTESRAFLVVLPVAMILSQIWPLGSFVARGGGDPIILTASTLYLYAMTAGGRVDQAAIMSYPVGFLVGFVSDIESQKYGPVIFGGYGILDGDFVIPLSFLIAVILLASTQCWLLRRLELLEVTLARKSNAKARQL